MNFDFLKRDDQRYELFAGACIEAEKAFATSPAMCAIGCRKALELAVKWTYAADESIHEPYRNNLASLIDERTFKNRVDERVWRKLRQVNRLGNRAVHTERHVKPQEAILSLRTLFDFVSWIDFRYGPDYIERVFDEGKIPQAGHLFSAEEIAAIKQREALLVQQESEIRRLERRIQSMTGELECSTLKSTVTRAFNPDEVNERETRKLYIDEDLQYAGWRFDGSIVEEREVEGMPEGPESKAGKGRIDYMLLGKDGKPLAIVEAKRTMVSPLAGLQQARLYAKCLKVEYGYTPLIFLSNGFETFFCDDAEGPCRPVSGFFSRAELQTIINRRSEIKPLADIKVNENTAGRYYQIRAIRKVCANIEAGNRKSLLVMATGTGKTRVSIGLVDVLMRANRVKNVLFLADRVALVAQAKHAFQEHLPNTSLCNLCRNKEEADARVVFSTYKTILNAIDKLRTEDGNRLYTPAHFDLIIVDEAHRSIFNKYRAIFEYFDALCVGLTATPADDVDRNTYDFFEVERGIPTDVYTYEEAVDPDSVLVPYLGIETHTDFLDDGITYADLSDDDRAALEEAFIEEGEEVPEVIPESALGTWLFNDGTVDSVLQTLMDKGIRVDGGETIGKTIIFAASQKHAEFIVERFGKLYSGKPGDFIKCVIHGDRYSDSIIDEFKLATLPKIVVSVDKMDTGIDVPEIVNLVFFKKVRSKIKFWQMIGRGTRKCPDLDIVDPLAGAGPDKTRFFIFDWCRNFEYFNEGGNAVEGSISPSQSEKVFSRQAQLACDFQSAAFAAEEWQAWRENLVSGMHGQVMALNDELVTVRLRRPAVQKFKQLRAFDHIDSIGLGELQMDIAPLVRSDEPDIYALRFDALMYGFMCALCSGIQVGAYRRQLTDIALGLQKMIAIPQVKERLPYLKLVSSESFFEGITALDLEETRKELRDIVRFLERAKGKKSIIYTSLADPVTGVTYGITLPPGERFDDYEAKVTHFLQNYKNNAVIRKIHRNEPLSDLDCDELEQLFTQELGSAQDYHDAFGNTPFGLLVRNVVKLSHTAVTQAFAEFLNNETLTEQQIGFVETVIRYIESNGYMELSALRMAPFDRPQSFVRLFDEKRRNALVEIIQQIKRNAERPAA